MISFPSNITNPPPLPILAYDGDCGFCRRWIARWREMTGDAVVCEPLQTVAPRYPAIPRSAFEEAVKLIEPDGRVSSGAEAVFRSLAHGPGRGAGWWLYRRVPGFAPISESAYRFIANHRMLISRLTALFSARPWIWAAAGILLLAGIAFIGRRR